ncbi:TolC family protein [Neolewinella lacunae]|uniref:TolC family protein n=1 Tax=Neolewinella lacunae TaxID=1517758 RepID=A0A923PMZ8_9BACT|nr:TolC family protein [Neolewinella lacunae]MBC6995390.1 TolC family protein [Neolewinella lacunae]MDN3633102.1 TolC family protein [Neolewinella lacunae]
MRTLQLCFLIPLLCTCVSAQQSLSLSDAIQLGLANNYQIRLAQANLDVARNDDNYALTGKMPTITLGLSPGIGYRSNNNPASIVVSSSTFSYNVAPAANLNWTLFNGGRIEMTKDRLATLADLSAGQLQIQVENTLAAVINAYYNAVVQQEQLEVRQRVLGLSRDRITYQQIRAEYGQGGTFEELQARDAYLTDSTNLVVQQLNLQLAIRNLLQVVGEEDLNQELTLTTPLDEVAENYDRAGLENQLLATNSQLRTLRVNQVLASLNTRLIAAEHKPTIGLTAGVSYDYSLATGTQTFVFGDGPPDPRDLPGIGATTLNGQLGFTVNHLLFDGGARNVRTQSAKLQEITARLDVEATSQQLRATLLNTLDRYENQRAIVDLTRRLIANAEQNLNISEERLKGGTINSFDYRAIQLNYVNAEFQLLNALLNLKNTETELLRLTGQIVD